jgi:hypothetical protein
MSNPGGARAITTATEAILIGECECGVCGRTYDFEREGAECSDQCPTCAAAEEEQARLGEESEERRAEAQDELDEAEAERSVRSARRKLARRVDTHRVSVPSMIGISR